MRLLGKDIPTRRVVIVAISVAAYIAATMLSYSLGKAYYVYIDNSDAEDGAVLADPEGITVSVDGAEASEYYPRDKDRLRLRGKTHSLGIKRFSDESVVTKKVSVVGFGDSVNVSIPLLLADKEGAVTAFKPFVPPTPEAFTPGTTDGSAEFVIPEQKQ